MDAHIKCFLIVLFSVYYCGRQDVAAFNAQEYYGNNKLQKSIVKHDPPVAAKNSRKIVCYYTNWSQYRPGEGKFFPENLNLDICTHFNYAFAKIDGGRIAPYEWDDDTTPWKKGLYERFTDLKKNRTNLKMLLSVGGWNLGSQPFSSMATSESTRKIFIDHAIQFLRNRSFDGLDLDWEYPANRGSPSVDRQRFTLLLKELRAAFDDEVRGTGRPALLLSAAVGAGKSVIDTAYDIPEIFQYVDYVSLMSYDLHGSWEQYTGINSPLYPLPQESGLNATLNQDWAVKHWLAKGAPAEKIMLGIAAYGRTFTLANASNHDIGAPSNSPGLSGEYTRTSGFLAYYEICKRLQEGWQQVFQNDQKAFYAYHGNQWVGYDSVESVKLKTQYAKNSNLGGVMIWALPIDDFTGTFCGLSQYPLLNAVSDVLVNTDTV